MKFFDKFFSYYIVPYFWCFYVCLRLQDILFKDNIAEMGIGRNRHRRLKIWTLFLAGPLTIYMTLPIILGFTFLPDPAAINLMFIAMIFFFVSIIYTFIRYKHMSVITDHPLITKSIIK